MHPSPSPSSVLLVIAHGSRDPRHAATVQALTARVRALRPGLRVEASFLDFNAPSVESELDRLAAQGEREVVALPLLLTRAFHAKADIPAVLDAASVRLPGLRIRRAKVLGPSPLLLAAVQRRLEEALHDAGLRPRDKSSTGVVLASAGSTDPEAIAVIAEIARELRNTGWCSVRPAFASAALPRTEDAVRALRTEPGVKRVAVAPYVLAPGFLPDRIARGAAEADLLAQVLGDCAELAHLVVRRYEAAARPRRAVPGPVPARTVAGAVASPPASAATAARRSHRAAPTPAARRRGGLIVLPSGRAG
ncbi:sirohydrochlorin ferrochelatase [Streptomyces candidus]|uniref:Sirohydrochlorin ferrochelatase n=1 Tax=Streptomyces candidus TaxID=67283 RepID=A0A7X0LN12_9ACTN|nr:sirohydrochlorin ferrochelatase [Streptomyces candidus]GHH36701.1 sirohydrochlorin chelatase [Streptomyces candidus]